MGFRKENLKWQSLGKLSSCQDLRVFIYFLSIIAEAYFRPCQGSIRGHLFSSYTKISEKINISYPLIRTCMRAYQGVRNVNLSENFALNE